MDEVIRRCLLEFYEIGLPEHVRRDVDPPLMEDAVITIVGGRRVGKTYLTYQIIEDYIQRRIVSSIDHVCYVHFDDERLIELQVDDLRRIDEIFLEISGATAKTKLLFVFDEIHRIRNWELFVLRLNRNPNWRVVVTGSSSDLEEDKVGRQLRGKTFTIRLHPLSFQEYLRFLGQDPPGKRISTQAAAKFKRLFRRYMETGSYPAVVDLKQTDRREVLRQYFNAVVASDFVDTKRIVRPLSCKLYLRNLLQRNASAYTHKKERNILSSMGHKIQPDTVADWFNWARESYFIGVNTIDSPSIKKQEQNYRKIYAIDWALANTVSSFAEPRTSRVLESIIYWHIQRSGLHTSYALLGRERHEIDFMVSEPGSPPHLAVQVCQNVSDPRVWEREIRGLVKVTDEAEVEPLVIVLDEPPASLRKQVPMERAWEWCLHFNRR